MNDCIQKERLQEIINRIVELEKSDIKIQSDIRILENNITDLSNNIDDVKEQMRIGFDRISSIVFRAMLGIISILLTALGVLVYNFIIL